MTEMNDEEDERVFPGSFMDIFEIFKTRILRRVFMIGFIKGYQRRELGAPDISTLLTRRLDDMSLISRLVEDGYALFDIIMEELSASHHNDVVGILRRLATESERIDDDNSERGATPQDEVGSDDLTHYESVSEETKNEIDQFVYSLRTSERPTTYNECVNMVLERYGVTIKRYVVYNITHPNSPLK
ncbi:unnamed protein product [marine sediment metagenome]|uniref:Uncharacterized protein n=1 Tax=marine sediment metagenome TaxID=412755 RepID=X1GDD5_9ZZZZ